MLGLSITILATACDNVPDGDRVPDETRTASRAHQEPALDVGGANDDAAARTVQDLSRWKMPLDEFRVDDAYTNALAVLAEPCMRSAGYDHSRPAIDVRARSASVSEAGRVLFDVEVAEKWGYGGAPDPNSKALEIAEAEAASWSEAQSEAYSRCLDQAHERLEIPDNNNFLSGLALSAWNGATRDPAVLSAAEAWRECMAPLGIPDLPVSPVSGEGLPTSSMAATFGLVVDGRSNEERTRSQRAEEIKVAVFDAECRDTTGFSEALYQAEWMRQTSLVAENGPALAALKSAKIEYESRAIGVFREAGLEW